MKRQSQMVNCWQYNYRATPKSYMANFRASTTREYCSSILRQLSSRIIMLHVMMYSAHDSISVGKTEHEFLYRSPAGAQIKIQSYGYNL